MDGAPSRCTLDRGDGAPRPLEPLLEGFGVLPCEDLLETRPHGVGGVPLGFIAIPFITRLVNTPLPLAWLG